MVSHHILKASVELDSPCFTKPLFSGLVQPLLFWVAVSSCSPPSTFAESHRRGRRARSWRQVDARRPDDRHSADPELVGTSSPDLRPFGPILRGLFGGVFLGV